MILINTYLSIVNSCSDETWLGRGTGEDAILIICPGCGAEHWVSKYEVDSVGDCDVCGYRFPQRDDVESDNEGDE